MHTPRLLTPALLLAACFSTAASAQVISSGLVHVPLGGGTVSTSSDHDRTIVVTGIGPGGPGGLPTDGVSILHSTLNGIEAEVDLGGVLSSSGAACRAAFRDNSGIEVASLSLHHTAHGQMSCAVDFSAIAPPHGVEFILHDRSGAVLARGDTAVFALACTASVADFPSSGGTPGSPPSSPWRMRCANGTHIKHVKIECRTGVFTVSGLTTTPITDVHSITFRPIVCITEPCPGPFGWSSCSALDITAANLPGGSLTVRNSAATYSITPIGDPTVERRTIPVWGTASALIGEPCAIAFPPGCDFNDPQLSVTTLAGLPGSTPSAGIVLDLQRSVSLHQSDLAGDGHQDLLAASVTVHAGATFTPDPLSPPTLTAEYRRWTRIPRGTIEVCRVHIQPDPISGVPHYSCDSSSRGSTATTVECLSATGVVLGSAVLDISQSVSSPSCAASGDITYIGTCDAEGRVTLELCSPSATCAFPDGTAIAGVHSLRFSALNPTEPAGPIAQCAITGNHLTHVVITQISSRPPTILDGTPVSVVGDAVHEVLPNRRLHVSNIGSSGQDGVDIHLDSVHGGGVFVDLHPLLGTTGAITINTSHIEYKTADRVILTGAPGGSITETVDLAAAGATGFTWQAFTIDGTLIADGSIAGPIASWTITPSNAAADTIDKCYFADTGTSVVSAKQGFFDICSISGVSTTPLDNVALFQYTPQFCPGCPNPLTGLSTIRITASDISHFDIRAPFLHAEITDPTGTSPPSTARCEGLGRAVIIAHDSPLLGEGLVVRNIGSSGQDGVRVHFFGPIGPPPPATVSFQSCGSWGETTPITFPPAPAADTPHASVSPTSSPDTSHS